MQGKKIVKEIGEGWVGLAQHLRISTGKTLYIENLHRLLYPPVRSEMGKMDSPVQKPKQIIKYLERISQAAAETPAPKRRSALEYNPSKLKHKTPLNMIKPQQRLKARADSILIQEPKS